jgi:hypothetical protein
METFIGFEIFIVVSMNNSVFWDFAGYSLVYRRFGGAYCFRLQCLRVIQTIRKQILSIIAYLFSFFLLCLFFDHEDGSSKFFCSVDLLLPDYIVSYPWRQYFSWKLLLVIDFECLEVHSQGNCLINSLLLLKRAMVCTENRERRHEPYLCEHWEELSRAYIDDGTESVRWPVST